jgi:hypothetical protein
MRTTVQLTILEPLAECGEPNLKLASGRGIR